MIAVGSLLAGIGIGDLIGGGLGGQPPRRRLLSAVAALVTAALLPLLVGVSLPRALATGIVVAAVTAAWQWLRDERRPSEARAWWAVGVLVTGLAAAVWAGPELTATGGTALVNWAARHDVRIIAVADAGRVVLVVGILLAELATANALVRLVLVAAGPDVVRAGTRLRGGRLIGPLERALLFGLAASGQPTAAGLVVAAKSALRFPELTAAGRADPPAPGAIALDPLERVDAATEYVLLGSLTSWLLALAPVLLL